MSSGLQSPLGYSKKTIHATMREILGGIGKKKKTKAEEAHDYLQTEFIAKRLKRQIFQRLHLRGRAGTTLENRLQDLERTVHEIKEEEF